jgi:hypothetical protein
MFVVDSHWAWRNPAELTNIVLMQDDRYSWTEVGAEPGVIAAAVPGRGLIFLFPVLFSAGQEILRRSLSEITIGEGTCVDDLWNGIAQTITHERSRCSLLTLDMVYRWDKCTVLAARHCQGTNLLDNADTVSAIVFFLWCLIARPELDFSTGRAEQRRQIPPWVVQFRTGVISAEAVMMEPPATEARVVHLRNRDVVWRLSAPEGAANRHSRTGAGAWSVG